MWRRNVVCPQKCGSSKMHTLKPMIDAQFLSLRLRRGNKQQKSFSRSICQSKLVNIFQGVGTKEEFFCNDSRDRAKKKISRVFKGKKATKIDSEYKLGPKADQKASLGLRPKSCKSANEFTFQRASLLFSASLFEKETE